MYKLKAFEYICSLFYGWYYEVESKKMGTNRFNGENDLSKLKTMKLLFFISAVEASASKEGLLDIFDSFYAMPYGHVESEIYKNLDRLQYIQLDYKSMQTTPQFTASENIANKERIDSSFQSLKSKNPKLISMRPFELVDLSHKWFSWQYFFRIAQNKGKYSSKIPIEFIQNEKKIFH